MERKLISRAGQTSGSILGALVIVIWVFFFLKYSIGYINIKSNMKSFSPVIATITYIDEKKTEGVDEDGHRTVDYTYYISVEYDYNGTMYYTQLSKSYKPSNTQVTLYVDPYNPSYYIEPGKESEYFWGLMLVLFFLGFAVLLAIPQMIKRHKDKREFAMNRQKYYENRSNIEYDIFNSQNRFYDTNLSDTIPRFNTEFEKSGETVFIDSKK